MPKMLLELQKEFPKNKGVIVVKNLKEDTR